ncbi:MAG: hypothetical protein IJL89_02895, partial [Firmicutes bacterium]|nr:hypothetical protein [Bacillota bacterium]
KIMIKKKKRPNIPLITAIIFALFFGLLVILRLTVFDKKVNFWRQNGLDARRDYNLVIGAETVGEGVIENNGIFYISLDAVKEHIDPNIYYNVDAGRVIITTDTSVLRFTADETSYLLNDAEMELNFPVFDDNGDIYLPAETVESIYGYESRLYDTGIFSLENSEVRAKLAKKAKLTVGAGSDEYYLKLKKDTPVAVYGEEDTYTLIKVLDGEYGGFFGYVDSDKITDRVSETKEQTKHEVWKPNGYIDLVFDQISNAAGASLTMSDSYAGVNVFCPTWFSFEDAGGEVINRANKDYVNWAHARNCKVWGLITDNFDSSVSHAVLTDDETRHYAIKQIIAYADMYELDGINIDFEAVPKADGEYWVQFLRELAPLCHQNGLTLSCDLFVARPWSAHYSREKVGEVVDYVIVMGYDEHYGGGSEAGSVASMDWSREAISGTVNAGVPAEKIILGIPFYTRIWTEGEALASKAYSMDAAFEIMQENNAAFSYDEETEQDYAEYTDSEGRHRCWLETADTAVKRTRIAAENNTAGVAAWKLRMESGDTLARMAAVLDE